MSLETEEGNSSTSTQTKASGTAKQKTASKLPARREEGNASTSTQAKTPGTAKKKTVSKLQARREAGNTKQIIKHENPYVHGEY